MSVAASCSFTPLLPAASFFSLFSSFFLSFFLLFSSFFFSFFLLFLSCSNESKDSGLAGVWGGRVSSGGSPGGLGLRGRRSLRWRWGWSLSLSFSLSWSLGWQPLLLWMWGKLFVNHSQNRFIIPRFINRSIIHLRRQFLFYESRFMNAIGTRTIAHRQHTARWGSPSHSPPAASSARRRASMDG